VNAIRFRPAVVALLFSIIVAVSAQAQTNEFAFEASGLFTSSQFKNDAGVGFQLNYAHRLFHVPLVSIYGEIPFVAGFDNTQYSLAGLVPQNYNNYYVTPGVKVKFAPGFIFSPYLAAGVGWVHFSSTQSSASENKFAADWGGGLDTKIFPFVSFRLEARDFYSDVPSLLVPASGKQNNVVVSGGLVLRF
jgi:opacity protein-like surface antigen